MVAPLPTGRGTSPAFGCRSASRPPRYEETHPESQASRAYRFRVRVARPQDCRAIYHWPAMVLPQPHVCRVLSRAGDTRDRRTHRHEGRRRMSYPPIKNGTRVKITLRQSGKNDYTAKAAAWRALHDGSTGVVCGYHDSHGLCYGVKFEDGVVAFFDPDELEVAALGTGSSETTGGSLKDSFGVRGCFADGGTRMEILSSDGVNDAFAAEGADEMEV